MATAPAPPNTDATPGGADGGATMSTEYADQDQLVTVVVVEDLRDWRSAMREESWQFSLGGFFASGSLWLGIERLATYGSGDKLFLLCVIVLVASGVVGFFGYKQLGRRQKRIDRYIIKAESQQKTLSTQGTTP